MADMPRPRLPRLHVETTRHGKRVWYVRAGKGKRIRLRAPYGSREFQEEYDAAIAGRPLTGRAKATAGTLEWAASLYKQSAAWTELSPATRRQRDNILKRMVDQGGDYRLAEITPKRVMEGIDKRRETPAAARHYLETLRGMMRWAVKAQLVHSDPTAGLEAPAKTGPGFPVWTEADMDAFRRCWPVGTRERLAFEILLWTGLRRGDAAVLGRQHVKDGVIRINTEKTGERVAIVIEPELQSTLDATKCGELTFVAQVNGQPMTKESFGNWFGDTCRAAGLKKSAHGIRKVAATRDAEAGWSESELEAKYGWSGGQMASKYTRSMRRERLSIEAAKRTRERTSIPSPDDKVRDGIRKG